MKGTSVYDPKCATSACGLFGAENNGDSADSGKALYLSLNC